MKSPFLLDTCAAIWFLDAALPKVISELTEAFNQGRETLVSPITAWEVSVSARKGGFASSLTPQRWFERLMNAPGMALAGMSPAVLIASQELLHFPTDDPADRIIAATAREFGYTVVTRGRALLDYGKQGYLNVLEC